MTAPVPEQPQAPQAPNGQSAPYTPPATAHAQVSHPIAPTPPRSRIGAHVLSLFAGIVLTPVAIALLAGGAHALSRATTAGQDTSVGGLVAVIAAAGLLGLVAATTAGSAVGSLVSGVGYGVAPGVGFLVAPESVSRSTARTFDLVGPLGNDDVLAGLLALGRTAGLLLLGLTLVLVGVAATIARRAGKAYERDEALATVAAADLVSPFAAGGRPPTVPTPPRARGVDHLVALAIGALMTPVALALIAAGSAEVAAVVQRGDDLTAGLLLGSGVLGTGLLVAIVLAAGWSSFGLLTASLAYGVVPGAMGLLSPIWLDRAVGGFLGTLGEALDPISVDGLTTLTELGVLLAWGAVGALGALGVHAARRDGRRRERAEIAVMRATGRPVH